MLNGKPVLEMSKRVAGSPDWEHGHIALGIRGLVKGMKMTVTSVEMHRLP